MYVTICTRVSTLHFKYKPSFAHWLWKKERTPKLRLEQPPSLRAPALTPQLANWLLFDSALEHTVLPHSSRSPASPPPRDTETDRAIRNQKGSGSVLVRQTCFWGGGDGQLACTLLSKLKKPLGSPRHTPSDSASHEQADGVVFSRGVLVETGKQLTETQRWFECCQTKGMHWLGSIDI
jgi:hypothetical protein